MSAVYVSFIIHAIISGAILVISFRFELCCMRHCGISVIVQHCLFSHAGLLHATTHDIDYVTHDRRSHVTVCFHISSTNCTTVQIRCFSYRACFNFWPRVVINAACATVFWFLALYIHVGLVQHWAAVSSTAERLFSSDIVCDFRLILHRPTALLSVMDLCPCRHSTWKCGSTGICMFACSDTQERWRKI